MSNNFPGKSEVPPRRLSTVSAFSKRHEAFTESSLRWMIHAAKPRNGAMALNPPNGFAEAFVRIGRRVLIDDAKFFEIVAKQSGQATHG